MRLPLLFLHIAGGVLGILAGFVAMFLRKGTRRHALAGDLFVVSMIAMSVCGFVLAFMKHEISNEFGGALTFYMVFTAWLTARRREIATSYLDWGALALVLAVGSGQITYGIEALLSPTGLKEGYPPPLFFIFGSLALLAAVGDVRLLVRGGIAGTQRLFRHLWRMGFGLFIATASLFLGQQQVFPAPIRKMSILAPPVILSIALLLFWMIRISLTKFQRFKAAQTWQPQTSKP
ncbi:MAG TPA: hypothetical protein VKV39_11955 [Candidatus Sulfotelmatobacter sp.]|nr:hypothetical protein [Candidatus Sulfotelmatobacter sp.]